MNGELLHYEHFIRSSQVKTGWFDFTIGPLFNPDDIIIGIMIIGNNINDQKNSASIIQKQSKHLSFISQLQSHQVRQPVATILGLMYLIKEDNYLLKKEYLLGLEEATKKLDEIIRVIVSQSRESGLHAQIPG